MSNSNYETIATEYLYAFRAGRFYEPSAVCSEQVRSNKSEIISTIRVLPLGHRTNQGALKRDGPFRQEYSTQDANQSLSARSWRYARLNDQIKARVLSRIESINCKQLYGVVSEFIKESLQIAVGQQLSLCVYGGYLWNERPGDVDILAIVEDPSACFLEVGGWTIRPAKSFSEGSSTMNIDLSIIGSGAINSVSRNRDLFNVLGWYSGGGVTLYGAEPLSAPLPDFITAYLPLETVGFCLKELLRTQCKPNFLAYRLDECWAIINWLNNLYPADTPNTVIVEPSFKPMNHAEPVRVLSEHGVLITKCVRDIAARIKQTAIKALT